MRSLARTFLPLLLHCAAEVPSTDHGPDLSEEENAGAQSEALSSSSNPNLAAGDQHVCVIFQGGLNVTTPTQVPAENSSTRIYELEVSGSGGLVRFAVATRWGSNGTTAARITNPTLVMVGNNDNVATAAASDALYNAGNVANAGLQAISKTLVKMECASHSIFLETCINTGNRACNNSHGPHEALRRNAIDWIKTGMIYASPGASTGAFGTSRAGANYHDPPASPVLEMHEENAL